MRKFLLLGFIFFSITAQAQSTEPVLRINPNTHSGTIHRIATNLQGKYLLTASSDKTARLWDAQTGHCLRVFRPPIGTGREGELFACALSPCGTVAAIAGMAGTKWGNEIIDTVNIADVANRSNIARYSIYLFSTVSGETVQSFDAVGAEVLDLSFSPDGKKLVAAMGNARGLLVFDLPSFSIYRKIIGYSAPVRRIAFSKLNEMAAIADDGMVCLYDSSFELKKTKLLRGRLSALTFSPDGNELAVAFADNTPLLILDAATLDIKQNPALQVPPDKSTLFSQAAFSPDGALYTAGYCNSEGVYQLRCWKAGAEPIDIMAAGGSINNIMALPDGSVVYTSACPEIGRILPDHKTPELWTEGNRKGNYLIAAGTHIFTPEINSCLQVNVNGSEVGFAGSGTGILFFSINRRKLYEGASSYSTATSRNTTFGISISRWRNNQLPYLNSIAMSVFEKDEVGVCVDIAENGKIILMGTGKHVYALDRHGGLLWKRPVQEGATAVKMSGNGRIAVATLGNGTLAWFKASDGQHLATLFPLVCNRKWIMWTPEGFYDCTAGAEELAGWHINRGLYAAAGFYPLSQFREIFYRPDIIDVAVTETLTAMELLAQVPDREKRIEHILPPTVRIVSPAMGSPVECSTIKMEIGVTVTDGSPPPSSLKIVADGRPLQSLTSVKNGINVVELQLPPKNCTVSAIAENRYGADVTASIVTGNAQQAGEISGLHILSIGINEYNSGLRLRYPAKDAVDFAGALKQTATLSHSVATRLLVNEQASKGNIMTELNRLKKVTGKNDVAIIFMAGHCFGRGAGRSFFMTAESSVSNIRSAGISFNDIKKTVSQIAGTVILFLDISHSGNLSEIKTEDIACIDGVVNELASPETGVAVFTSSTGRGLAVESPEWGNGAFAKALIEGVTGAAFALNSTQLSATQLNNYIAMRMKELTNDEMQPALVMPANVPDLFITTK